MNFDDAKKNKIDRRSCTNNDSEYKDRNRIGKTLYVIIIV